MELDIPNPPPLTSSLKIFFGLCNPVIIFLFLALVWPPESSLIYDKWKCTLMLQISCHIPQMLLASLSHSLFFSFWTLSRLSVPLTFGSGLLQNTYPCSPVSSLPCDLVPSLRCVLLKFASVYQLYERSSFVEHTARFYERSREFLGAAPFSSRLFSSWRGRPGIRNHPLTNTTNLKNVTLNLAFQIYIFWVLGYIRYAVLATLSSAPSRPCMPLLTQLGVHT